MLSSNIKDIDSYAANLQSTVYNYFGATCGMLKNRRSTQDKSYSDMTIKELKVLLAKAKSEALKNNTVNAEEISTLSRTIRHRLASQRSEGGPDAAEKHLKDNF